MPIRRQFRKFAEHISILAGSPAAFLFAVTVVLIWFSTGFIFKWSEMHSLAINTFTTITTFLMVFVLQASQNRNSKMVQAQLKEIVVSSASRNRFALLDDLDDEEIQKLEQEVRKEAAEREDELTD